MTTNKTRAIILNTASALGLFALLLLATGSGKGGASTSSSGDADNSSAAATDPTEPKVSVSGKAVPNYEYIRGTCVNAKKGQCEEYYGLIPKFAPDMCKDEGGTFTTSSPTPNPCAKTGLIGTCHYPQSAAGEPGEFANYYANNAQSAAALKKDCTESASSKTEWIDPPAAPAASAAAPAGSAHAAPKPAAAKPSASAKPAPAASKK
jgi:hypothetical protein